MNRFAASGCGSPADTGLEFYTGLTSAKPSNKIAQEAVCHSIRVNMKTPPLQTMGRAAMKQKVQVPAVTWIIILGELKIPVK